MEIDYSALKSAATSLANASSQVSGEPAPRGDLGSDAAGPNDAYSSALGERQRTLQEFGELMAAQSRSCAEMITLFKLLDAQIASQVGP